MFKKHFIYLILCSSIINAANLQHTIEYKRQSIIVERSIYTKNYENKYGSYDAIIKQTVKDIKNNKIYVSSFDTRVYELKYFSLLGNLYNHYKNDELNFSLRRCIDYRADIIKESEIIEFIIKKIDCEIKDLNNSITSFPFLNTLIECVFDENSPFSSFKDFYTMAKYNNSKSRHRIKELKKLRKEIYLKRDITNIATDIDIIFSKNIDYYKIFNNVDNVFLYELGYGTIYFDKIQFYDIDRDFYLNIATRRYIQQKIEEYKNIEINKQYIDKIA